MELKKGTVLVTGGTGFIGKNLIDKLLKEGYSVISVGRGNAKGAENINVNLMDTDFSFLDNLKFDYVVHLAAFSSPARSVDEKRVMELNYVATSKFFSRLLKKDVKKIIFMSSSAVYAESENPLKENHPLNMNGNLYAKSKVMAEEECRRLSLMGLPLITFRLSNCYGPGQQWKEEEKPTLVPKLIYDALFKSKLEIFKTNPLRDYIYVDDVSDAIIKSFESRYSGILNLGTGVGATSEDLALQISGALNVEIDYVEPNVKLMGKVVLDIEKTSSILDWHPKTSLKEGISKTIDFYKNTLKSNKIPLIKSTFYEESQTKELLRDFIDKSSKLSMGPKVREFEDKFSEYQGRKYSVLFNSGSSANLALIQAMLNLGKLEPGNKVGFSALTWPTNVFPLMQLGLEPVPMDVSPKNLNVCSDNLIEALNKHDLKAVFVTNLLGFCGDLEKIRDICSERGIILLEDNCESLGSSYGGKKLGNFGEASTFSFFVGHHMSTVEGGMVCTDDKDLFEMLKIVRAHGWSRDLDDEKRIWLRNEHGIDEFFDKYSFYFIGYNLRPTEITGFLGLEQLKHIESIVKKRNENFKVFHDLVLKVRGIEPVDTDGLDIVSNFAYPLVFRNKSLCEKAREIFQEVAEIRPIVGGSIVEQPFFKEYLRKKGLNYYCPNAQKIHSQGFYFPNNPELNEDEIQRFLSKIREIDSLGDNSFYKEASESSGKMKKAFITGITGQDGSYLAELLLEKGYEVHGLVRRTSSFNRDRLKNIYGDAKKRHPNLFLHYGDMTDSSSLIRVLAEVMPDEIYNLAAQSHVQVSFEIPEYTATADALGVLKIIEAVRKLGLNKTRIYQASTSELFGLAQEVPQRESTPFYPRSPYGVAKLYAHWIIKNYREAYNMYVCSGILFNHESPRRGENFVTRKITKGVAEIKLGISEKIYLGNLNAKRDWGYAPDFVEAMWMMLQRDTPEDYVISTGEAHTVREFVTFAFRHVGIDVTWEGEGPNEKGIDKNTGKVLVEVDSKYFRPTEVESLLGDYSKARMQLGWEPKTRFSDLVKVMVEADVKELEEKMRGSGIRNGFS